jgi:hypothetical protein
VPAKEMKEKDYRRRIFYGPRRRCTTVANMASYAICSEFDFGDSWQHDHWD